MRRNLYHTKMMNRYLTKNEDEQLGNALNGPAVKKQEGVFGQQLWWTYGGHMSATCSPWRPCNCLYNCLYNSIAGREPDNWFFIHHLSTYLKKACFAILPSLCIILTDE